ncbi:MAG: hypothetical protein ACRDDX_13985 [Cellulosilyticaceae bacterium]
MQTKQNKSITMLKEQLDREIANENYEKVEKLSKELCNLQGFQQEIEMPESFVFKIKQKEKGNRVMKIKRGTMKVAGFAVATMIMGGSVYAMVNHFRDIQMTDYGLSTTPVTSKDASNQLFENPNILDDKNDAYVVSKENQQDTNTWLSKEVRKEIYPVNLSDDGSNWTNNEVNEVEVTEFTYKDYATACKDVGIDNIFESVYEQEGDVTYTEYIHGQDSLLNQGQLVANFRYNAGVFEIKQLTQFEPDEKGIEVNVITSTKPVENKRTYISKKGITFKLTEDEESGIMRITTMLVYNEHAVILSFENLSNEEIEEILETVIA